jgi:hypothetical protein
VGIVWITLKTLLTASSVILSSRLLRIKTAPSAVIMNSPLTESHSSFRLKALLMRSMEDSISVWNVIVMISLSSLVWVSWSSRYFSMTGEP